MNQQEFENGVMGLLKNASEARKQFGSPHAAGLDAGRNGNNLLNTAAVWFESRASSDDWSRGNKVGLRLRLYAERATSNPEGTPK